MVTIFNFNGCTFQPFNLHLTVELKIPRKRCHYIASSFVAAILHKSWCLGIVTVGFIALTLAVTIWQPYLQESHRKALTCHVKLDASILNGIKDIQFNM